MAEVGSLRISLGLDSIDFTRGMKDIDTRLKAVNSEFRAAMAGAGRFDNSLDALNNRQQILNRTMEVHNIKVEELKRQYEESVRATGETSEATLRLATQYNNAVAAMRQAEDQLDLVNRRIQEQTDSTLILQRRMQELGQSFQNVGQGMNNVGQNLSSTLTPAITALGLGAGKVANDFDSASGIIQSELGITAEEAEKLEGVAKNLWEEGFGEDLASVSTKVAGVTKALGELSKVDLSYVTKGLDLFEQKGWADQEESLRAMKVLMEQFGMSSSEAMDYLTRGFQENLNYSGEFLDSVSEYSTYFKEFGFDADEMFSKLKSGAESGAFQIDKVGDAMKEFSLRAKDGSKTSTEAFEALGLNAGELTKQFNAGGEQAKKAFETVVQALQNTDSDTVKNIASTGLFGTQYEDLGEKAFAAMLSASEGLTNVEGATQSASDALRDNFGTRLTEVFRGFQDALLPLGTILLDLAEQWLPKISAGIQSVSEWFTNLSPTMQNVVVVIGAVAAAIGPLLMVIGTLVSSVGTILPLLAKVPLAFTVIKTALLAINPVFALISAAVVALGILIYKNWDEIKAWTIEAWGTISSWLKDTWDSIKETVSIVWGAIKEFFAKYWDEILAVITGPIGILVKFIADNWETIKSTIEEKMAEAKSKIEEIWNQVTTFFSEIDLIETAKRIITTLINGFSEMISPVLAKITELWNTSLNFFKSVNLIENAKAIFITFINGIGAKIIDTKNKVVELWNSAKGFLEGINLFEIGRNIIQGLVNGIGNMKDAAIAKAKEVGENIANTLKSFFGIASPSKLMTLYGEFIGDGLIAGMDNRVKAVSETASKLAMAVTTPIVGIAKAVEKASSSLGKFYGSAPRGGGGTIGYDSDGNIAWNTVGKNSGSSGGGSSKDKYVDEDDDGRIDYKERPDGSKVHYAYDKFHNGGWVGNAFKNLRFDEIPAILQKGEFVLSRKMIAGIDNLSNRINSGSHVPVNTDNNSRTINQNIVIHSPKPLSASETARKYKQASRQLALEW